MNSRLRIAETYNYFKKRKKENLFIGSLLFISGAIASSVGIIHLFNSLLNDGYSIYTFNSLIADILYSAILILPGIVLFSIGYLLWETHSLGWKLSIATCGMAALLAVANYVNIGFALPIGVLSGLAAILEIRRRRTSISNLKDSPLATENLAKFGLRLSGLVCMSILIGMIVYITVRASPYISWNLFTSTNWSWQNAAK